MLKAETWIFADEALEMGFATSIIGEPKTKKATASVHKALFLLMREAVKPNAASEPDLLKQVLTTPPEENPLQKFLSVYTARKD
jgi:hypothetical protein